MTRYAKPRPDPAAVMERDQRARKMQAFYEPAWFGPQKTSYGEIFGGLATSSPTTMGGFQHMPRSYVEQDTVGGFTNPNPGLTDQLQEEYLTRQLFDRPPVGQANLANYGQGQLARYGQGNLTSYGRLLREEDLRWRR